MATLKTIFTSMSPGVSDDPNSKVNSIYFNLENYLHIKFNALNKQINAVQNQYSNKLMLFWITTLNSTPTGNLTMKVNQGTGNMAKVVKALAAMPDGLRSITRTHMAEDRTYNHYNCLLGQLYKSFYILDPTQLIFCDISIVSRNKVLNSGFTMYPWALLEF